MDYDSALARRLELIEAIAAYLRRTRKGGDVPPLDALCGQLEQIALAAGV